METNEDFCKLCVIIAKRNKLQKEKTSAHHARARLENHLRNIKQRARIAVLEKKVDYKNNPEYKKLQKIRELVGGLKSASDQYKVTKGIENAESTIITTARYNQQRLDSEMKYYYHKHVPVRYLQMSSREFELKVKKVRLRYMQADVAISEFTLETHKERTELGRKFKIRQVKDANNHVNAIITHAGGDNATRFDHKNIERIANDYLAEKILLQVEDRCEDIMANKYVEAGPDLLK
jgi:hypothetical protein